ncbi:hypothetical protein F4802DRAFT_27510 [Xylaria palmicola]|nr:hypothetical protein F4802DRAFT_27510 [Xylaria palmicola]
MYVWRWRNVIGRGCPFRMLTGSSSTSSIPIVSERHALRCSSHLPDICRLPLCRASGRLLSVCPAQLLISYSSACLGLAYTHIDTHHGCVPSTPRAVSWRHRTVRYRVEYSTWYNRLISLRTLHGRFAPETTWVQRGCFLVPSGIPGRDHYTGKDQNPHHNLFVGVH